MSKVPNFQKRMAKVAQVLSNLDENFFDFFDFAVKKFRGSSLAACLPRVAGSWVVGSATVVQ
jgi:hypothetical protein